jgi:mannosylglucosylglycerate synthase
VGMGDCPDPNAKLHVLPLLSSRHPQIEAISDELNRGEVSPAFGQLVEQLTSELAAALTDCSVAIVHNVMTLHKNLAFTAALANLHQRGAVPRLIAWAHDLAWAEPYDLPQLHEGWPWSLLREPWPGVFYVAVSEHRRQTLANLLGLAVSEITAIPPGVDVARLFKLEEATQALVERFNLLTADPLLLLPARITRPSSNRSSHRPKPVDDPKPISNVRFSTVSFTSCTMASWRSSSVNAARAGSIFCS